jgi:hypothetical protein
MNTLMTATTYFQQVFLTPAGPAPTLPVAPHPSNQTTGGLLASRHIRMYVFLRSDRHRNRFSPKDLDRTRALSALSVIINGLRLSKQSSPTLCPRVLARAISP